MYLKDSDYFAVGVFNHQEKTEIDFSTSKRSDVKMITKNIGNSYQYKGKISKQDISVIG